MSTSFSATGIPKKLRSAGGMRVFHQPLLKNPVMVIAMEGWNDGGIVASAALRWLRDTLDAQRFATIDAEEFYVFTDTRPEVREDKQLGRHIIWPCNEFFHAKLPNSERDLVLFLGVEPNLRWKTYADLITQTAACLGVEIVFTLGGYLADVLHSTPVKIHGQSNDINLYADYNIEGTGYEGPTGIVGVCANILKKQNFTTVSLWAAVPHYISMPNPKGAYALLQKITRILNIKLNLQEWQQQIHEFDSEIDDIISKNPHIAAFVRELRKRELLS